MGFKVIKENIMKTNDDIASGIRKTMEDNGVLMINIISSPGAGKTSFLEKAGPMLRKEGVSFEIITGDCFTSRDAERMDAAGLPVTQINTGNSCHIDAQLVKKAVQEIRMDGLDLVIVENVGNLVCPAEFDIGEDHKISFHSTAEGHDKPLKYPLLVKESDYVIINKTDLIEHTDFDVSFFENSIKKINPRVDILRISCKTGEGIEGFLSWIKERIKEKKENGA